MSFTSTPSVDDLVDRARELARFALDLRRGLGELGGRNAAAVAANVPFELLLARERLDVRAPVRDHPLDERPDLARARHSPPRG